MIPISRFSYENQRFQALLDRTHAAPADILETVARIVGDVRRDGDEALFRYMEELDGIQLDRTNVLVSDREFQDAVPAVKPEFATALTEATQNLFTFHQHQLPKPYRVKTDQGSVLGRKYQPLNSVGICVPAAAAPLASSLYMNLIPALVAGVPDISIISSPAGGTIDPTILFTADFLGIRNVYKISGAQGVAALAYGTDSVKAVDKILGPGNLYVQSAKQLVWGAVGIDSFAGPSEIAIITDEKTPALFAAADLLSQAEHGSGFEASVAFCLTESKAEKIKQELERLAEENDLKDRVSRALELFGNIFIVDSIDTAIDAVNAMAPEHAEIMCRQPGEVAKQIRNAGAVFVGLYSPEPVGDYYCGSNHVLPTGGTARFSSGLNVMDFMRGYSVIEYTKESLVAHAKAIQVLATAEGMTAHALATGIRLK